LSFDEVYKHSVTLGNTTQENSANQAINHQTGLMGALRAIISGLFCGQKSYPAERGDVID